VGDIRQGFTFDDRDFRAPIGEHACGKETADAGADDDVLRRCRHCSLHSVQRLATLVEFGVELVVSRDDLVLGKFGDAAAVSSQISVDRDLIRGGHYGQRSCEPRSKAEHMAAPTSDAT
jgi:hypothetical protein